MQKPWLLVVAATLVLLRLPTASASAEPLPTYTVSACSLDGEPVPVDGWIATTTGSLASVAVNQCASKQGLGFTFDPVFGGVGRWTFVAPASTALQAAWFYGQVGSGDSRADLTAWTDGWRLPIGWWTDGNVEHASDPIGAPGLGSRVAGLEFGCTRGCTETASLRLARIDTLLVDGGLPTAEYDEATQTLHFADTGGGVETVDLEVDGQAVSHLAVGGQRCRRPFVYVVPCPLTGSISLADQGLEPGERSVFATITDVAGNHGYSGPHIVRIPSPPVSAPVVPREGVVIVDGASTRRAAYKEQTLTGIVRDVEGFPIPGAHLSASSRTIGQDWKVIGGFVADARGRFTVKVPKGPTREVRLAYLNAAQTVKLVVAAPLRLTTNRRMTRNGRTITFTGRIPEAGASQARVTLQARANGKWIPFRTVQLRNGSFKARYRFTGTFRTQRYFFRAIVGSAPGFVYEAGRSPVVGVLVRRGNKR
jgi:hypothetical protein